MGFCQEILKKSDFILNEITLKEHLLTQMKEKKMKFIIINLVNF